MTQYDRPSAWERHMREPTLHVCPCGAHFEKIRGTNMLACADCGEVRWLV